MSLLHANFQRYKPAFHLFAFQDTIRNVLASACLYVHAFIFANVILSEDSTYRNTFMEIGFHGDRYNLNLHRTFTLLCFKTDRVSAIMVCKIENILSRR